MFRDVRTPCWQPAPNCPRDCRDDDCCHAGDSDSLRRQYFLRLKARSVLDFARWGGAVHRSNEAITAAGERLNKDRSVCRFAQRIAQPLDRGIQAMIEVNEGVRRPELAAQFLAGNQLSRSFKQRRQDLQRLFR